MRDIRIVSRYISQRHAAKNFIGSSISWTHEAPADWRSRSGHRVEQYGFDFDGDKFGRVVMVNPVTEKGSITRR